MKKAKKAGYGSYPPAAQQSQGGESSQAPQQTAPSSDYDSGGGEYDLPPEGDNLEDLPW